eukprot:s774_g18.t1
MVVHYSGYSKIVVNGTAVTQATFALPTERPLYAIVDLIGATSSVSLVPDAQPPQTLATSGLIFSPPVLRDDPFTAPSEAEGIWDQWAPEDVEFDDSPPASPQEPPNTQVPAEAQPVQLPVPEEAVRADAEVVPEVQVVVTKVPSDAAVEDFDAKPMRLSSPRDDAVGAVLAAQALATEPKKEGALRTAERFNNSIMDEEDDDDDEDEGEGEDEDEGEGEGGNDDEDDGDGNPYQPRIAMEYTGF